MVTHNTAVCYKQLNDNDNAVSYYQKALKIDPSFFHSLRNLADIYLELNKKEEAKGLIERALKIKPDSAELIALSEKMQ